MPGAYPWQTAAGLLAGIANQPGNREDIDKHALPGAGCPSIP